MKNKVFKFVTDYTPLRLLQTELKGINPSNKLELNNVNNSIAVYCVRDHERIYMASFNTREGKLFLSRVNSNYADIVTKQINRAG